MVTEDRLSQPLVPSAPRNQDISVTSPASPTRNTERTRRAILQAAGELLAERGLSPSLSEIAAAAGVSKGGLLHHFPTRDNLFLEVVVDSLERFRAEVLRFVDLSENRPGKGLRAYVRALCGGSREAMRIFASEFCGPVESIPGVAQALSDDSRRWREFFSQDGLHPDRILVVQHAVEGFAGAAYYDDAYSDDTVDHARAVFLDLIDVDSWRPDDDSAARQHLR
ncbi:TetR/AcrR family transcriptional regulator [Gordonia lacunae]|nr:TetR/AcrR family transcriptional regulator [Gordonia lacunae]